MQSSGQYGIPDMQQFMVVGRGAPHMFTHSQDVSPPLHHQLQQHHHPQQQPIHQQQHHHAHQQQQSQHQLQQPQPQQQLQSQPQLQQPLNHQHHQQQRQQKSQASQQQQLVQQLGLSSGSPKMPSPLAASRHYSSQFQPLIQAGDALGDDDVIPEESDRGGGANRWPREETIALLRIRSEMDANFRDSGLKGPLWEEVSRKLGELGYHRSSKKCKEKFENVHKYYKKTKDGRSGRQDGKSYRFFSELEALYAASNTPEMGGSGGGSHVGMVGVNTAQALGAGASILTANGESGAAADRIGIVERHEISSALNFSCNSSGDDYGEPQDNEEQESRKKRKRKSWSSTKIFFEKLAKQVMEQQEALHQKFLETIERRDQERLIRDETYKRQEMARLNREHELRAQEYAFAAARDAALVSFLQNATGQTLQLPQMPLPSNLTQLPSTLITTSEVQEDQEKDSSDLNTSRWPKAEVHALIRLRSGMEPKFQEAGPKAHLWEEISTLMACMGFHRSAKRCKEKWENINKYFRKTKDSCRKRPENAKTCPYFRELETLYQKGVLSSPSSRLNKVESLSESLLENGTEDNEQAQGENNEMLATVSAGEIGPGAPATTSSTTIPLSSSQDHRISGDQVSKMARPIQAMPDSSSSQAVLSALNLERIHGGGGGGGVLSGSTKSLQVEGFVKEILEIQQQHHQRLLDEYERMEQAREMREQEKKKQQEVQLAQELSHSNARDNAALMALVHKLTAGDATDQFTISASPNTE